MKRLYLFFRVLLFFTGALISVFFLSRLILILSEGQWNEVLAVIVSCLFCVPGALIVWRTFFAQKTKSLQELYDEDSDALYKQVQIEIDKVESLVPKIAATETRDLIIKMCSDVSFLLFKVNEKTPNKRQSAAKILGTHLRIINVDILPQYIEMQDFPQYYDDALDKLAQAHRAIDHFDMFVHGSIKLLEDDDCSRFDVAIKILDPLEHVLLY